jgi:hypothetical protein
MIFNICLKFIKKKLKLIKNNYFFSKNISIKNRLNFNLIKLFSLNIFPKNKLFFFFMNIIPKSKKFLRFSKKISKIFQKNFLDFLKKIYVFFYNTI